jgi:hypothetical protein
MVCVCVCVCVYVCVCVCVYVCVCVVCVCRPYLRDMTNSEEAGQIGCGTESGSSGYKSKLGYVVAAFR